MKKIKLVLFVIIVSITMNLNAFDFLPFDAIYVADFQQKISVSGEAKRSLKLNNEGNFVLSSVATTMMASIEETSFFKRQDDKIMPLSYNYKRSVLGKTKSVNQTFDWNNMVAKVKIDKNTKDVNISNNVLDRASYSVILKRDVALGKKYLQYDVVNNLGAVELIKFEVVGEEIIKTNLGSLRTIKISRIRDNNSKRSTTIWLAKDWSYIIARLTQTENDGNSYQIDLKKANVNGLQVKGL